LEAQLAYRGRHRQVGAALGGDLDRRRERDHARDHLRGLVHHINPPSNIETIDPKTLHLTGEFSEPNLGHARRRRRQITSRIVATQFTFVPRCIVLPANRPVTLRFATPDVIHGILVTGTNVNTMIVPGYVSQVHTVFTRTGDLLMPCHEYAGSATARCRRRCAWFRRATQARLARRGVL